MSVRYAVIALHTGYYPGIGEITKEDLQIWGSTLSNKPLSIDHAGLAARMIRVINSEDICHSQKIEL